MIEAAMGHMIDMALDGKPRPVRGSPAYFELASALADVSIEATERTRERNQGKWTGAPSAPILTEQPSDIAIPVSIDGLFETYLNMLARSGRGSEAGKRWRPCFRDLISFLKHDDARQITKADLNRWIEHLRASKAEKTIKDVYLGSVKAVLGYAAEQDLILTNPARDVKIRV